jgi:hypothetical protein
MAFVLGKSEKWSERGLSIAIWATVITFLLGILHGLLETMGPYARLVFITWCSDTRFFTEQLMYIGALVFIGAKFFETRTIFTVGFDTLDSAKISMTGPDDNNTVWIGHRYGSRIEAETVASTIESRLKESAAG